MSSKQSLHCTQINLTQYNISVALSRLQGLHAEVHARAEPAVITYVLHTLYPYGPSNLLLYYRADITTIVNDGTGLAKDIATLIKDIQASPAEASKPDAATIL